MQIKTVYGASQVLVCICSYMPRLENSAGSSHPRLRQNVGSCLFSPLLAGFPPVPQYPHHILSLTDDLVLPSVCVTTLGNRNKLISERYQHFREHGLPYGLHDSLCTLHLFCSSRNAKLRHRRNTRYGWVANPYPTGTYTLQDAPSFAWRSNPQTPQLAQSLFVSF